MTWLAAFQCLECDHFWLEPAPADPWEVVAKVAAPAACPRCGAEMRNGQIELVSHCESKIAVMCYSPYTLSLPR